jgi:hypothetical protein
MTEPESIQEMVRRHVLEGEKRAARQRQLLAEMERDHPVAAEKARMILETLEKSLELARRHLKFEQNEAGPDI